MDDDFNSGYSQGEEDMLMQVKGLIRRKLFLNGEYVYVINCEDLDSIR